MGAIRVTQRLLVDRVLGNLGQQSRRILELQDQLATGQRVNKPSDDPLAARRAVAARTEVTKNEQYQINISTTGAQLTETDTTLQTLVDNLRRASELAVQGANGTINQSQRNQIALEVNQILETVLSQGNHVTNGRHIFGGTRTLTEPFTAARAGTANEITVVAYQGNDEKIEVEISEGVRVPINETGQDVFLQTTGGTVNIFQTLIQLREDLRTGNIPAVATRIGQLSTAQEQLLVAQSRIGAVQNRIERVDSNLQDINTQLQRVVSDNVDADFAEVVLNLNAQSNAYQAALNAGARVIQPSLLDFIR